MVIINNGDKTKTKANIYFKCKECNCEWYAEKKEVKISAPCLPLFYYMTCPNCGETVMDREI